MSGWVCVLLVTVTVIGFVMLYAVVAKLVRHLDDRIADPIMISYIILLIGGTASEITYLITSHLK